MVLWWRITVRTSSSLIEWITAVTPGAFATTCSAAACGSMPSRRASSAMLSPSHWGDRARRDRDLLGRHAAETAGAAVEGAVLDDRAEPRTPGGVGVLVGVHVEALGLRAPRSAPATPSPAPTPAGPRPCGARSRPGAPCAGRPRSTRAPSRAGRAPRRACGSRRRRRCAANSPASAVLLGRVGVTARLWQMSPVEKPTAPASRALADDRAHGRAELRRRWRALRVSHDRPARRAVTHERGGVHAGRLARSSCASNPGKAAPFGQPHAWVGRPPPCRARAATAPRPCRSCRPPRGDPAEDLEIHLGPDHEREVVVGVHVDEARREREARRVERHVRAQARARRRPTRSGRRVRRRRRASRRRALSRRTASHRGSGRRTLRTWRDHTERAT